MARRETTVTIDAPGRDKGKTFVITELPASRAEAWAIRALLVLVKSGAQVPSEKTGMAGLARAGMAALDTLDYETAKPLLDEMWTCVKYRHAPNHPLLDADDNTIDEVATRMTLRKAVLALHTDFFKAGDIPTTG